MKLVSNLLQNSLQWTHFGGKIKMQLKYLEIENDHPLGDIGADQDILFKENHQEDPEHILGWIIISIKDNGQGLSKDDVLHMM